MFLNAYKSRKDQGTQTCQPNSRCEQGALCLDSFKEAPQTHTMREALNGRLRAQEPQEVMRACRRTGRGRKRFGGKPFVPQTWDEAPQPSTARGSLQSQPRVGFSDSRAGESRMEGREGRKAEQREVQTREEEQWRDPQHQAPPRYSYWV